VDYFRFTFDLTSRSIVGLFLRICVEISNNSRLGLGKRLTTRSTIRENGTKLTFWVDNESCAISDPSQANILYPLPSQGETR